MVINRSAFKFIDCWDYNIYVCILLSLLAIGSVFGLKYRSVGIGLETMWSYLSVLLSDYFNVKQIKKSFDRLFAGLWLIICLMLLSLYSAKQYDIMIAGQTYDMIETYDDLHAKPQWTHLNIHAYSVEYLNQIMYDITDRNKIALKLLKRFVVKEPFGLLTNISQLRQLYKDVLAGNAVIIAPKFLGYYLLRNIESIFGNSYRQDIDYHISTADISKTFYFWGVNNERLNQSVKRMQQNGVYEYKVSKSLKPLGFGPDIYDKPIVDKTYDIISIADIVGVIGI
ncbi:unnamed protein product [Medioppia subpectinata]|uniref:Uncharacterized protein n=1 Tax=Medioppia subpectinata TaxID=1979941 RepID=A0A7R9L5T4_9ACAR|nr:unnamed protein product [Medioppia subpectinata]CAG2115864.1 unnamed protein product [Medioppia subpectinata]